MPHDKPISGLLLLEAAIAGVPATFLLAVYGPWAAIVATGEWHDSAWFAAAVSGLALAGPVALVQYWVLAVRTAKGKRHRLGHAFWLSVFSGVVVASFLLLIAWPVGVACVLPGLAAFHFVQVQRSLKSTSASRSAA